MTRNTFYCFSLHLNKRYGIFIVVNIFSQWLASLGSQESGFQRQKHLKKNSFFGTQHSCLALRVVDPMQPLISQWSVFSTLQAF